MEKIYEDFGRRLKRARRGAGLTQETLASRVGLSRTSVTNIEKGNQHVSLHVMLDLARAVGVAPIQLLPGGAALPDEGSQPHDASIEARLPTKVSKALDQLTEEQQAWVVRIVRGGKRHDAGSRAPRKRRTQESGR